MADDKKEKWLNFLALSTVIFAVCATLSTFKGGGYGSRALLNKTNASDNWAFYQAKSIKSSLTKNQKENLELQKEIIAMSPGFKNEISKYDSKISKYEKDIKRYEVEKDSISAVAKAFEIAIVDCQKHGAGFGYAVIYLQVSILLSSIAGLMKKKPVWYLSLAVGAVGIFYFLDGFFVFFK